MRDGKSRARESFTEKVISELGLKGRSIEDFPVTKEREEICINKCVKHNNGK